MTKKRLFWAAVILAVLAGVVYNSWPLGYALNPLVTHSGGLASELEALHQPYNWLFVLLDTLCGVGVIAAAAMLWHRAIDLMHKVVLVNFALFGLLTIADALLPMTCEPSLTVCPSLGQQPLLILHGVASIGSAIFLFVSAFIMWWHMHHRVGRAIMTALMVGWGVSGLLTLYFFFRPGPGYLAQDYYLILCGIWVALLPHMLWRLTHSRVLASELEANY
ncbi:MAG TPA: DUF998 domain-containing protein [Candidatus Saccharimonadales bacterium]|nr:DUF998 domain-containing protein [Candidatus Saccharimonadales bacterium]